MARGLQERSRDLTVGDGVFKGSYSFSSRFEEGEGTNPEELIAAAHAACFSMALANMMAEHGHPAESVRTTAKVHLRQTDAGPTIQRIDLETEGNVPGINEAHFAEHAEQAKAACRCRGRSQRRGDEPERDAQLSLTPPSGVIVQ